MSDIEAAKKRREKEKETMRRIGYLPKEEPKTSYGIVKKWALEEEKRRAAEKRQKMRVEESQQNPMEYIKQGIADLRAGNAYAARHDFDRAERLARTSEDYLRLLKVFEAGYDAVADKADEHPAGKQLAKTCRKLAQKYRTQIYKEREKEEEF